MILAAPKTLWAMVNLRGSVGGKYGANTHFSTHRRRRILQAAHGLWTTLWEGVDGLILINFLFGEDVNEDGVDIEGVEE